MFSNWYNWLVHKRASTLTLTHQLGRWRIPQMDNYQLQIGWCLHQQSLAFIFCRSSPLSSGCLGIGKSPHPMPCKLKPGQGIKISLISDIGVVLSVTSCPNQLKNIYIMFWWTPTPLKSWATGMLSQTTI